MGSIYRRMTCSFCGSEGAVSELCPDRNKGRSIDRLTLQHTRSAFYAECGADYERALTRLDQLTEMLRQFM